MTDKARIAHISGPTATIQNTPPLVTSNKARAKHGLPLRTNANGTPATFDALRAQRLAAPVRVYVEQFSAHPLESDAAELYAAPDGFLDANGAFHRERQCDGDTPVYEVELRPEDGLYPLPYMAVQSDGTPWEEEGATPGAPAAKSRQGFFPDGSRSFEEIDRLSVDDAGVVNAISSIANVDFFRAAPPGGFTKGVPGDQRSDVGTGDIPPEALGRNFFAYKPWHLVAQPPRPMLATITNTVQAVAASGNYDGIIWTQGSPSVEDSAYWFNLLIDTTVPICGNAAQRPHGMISNDGPKNIVDSVHFIASRIWADGAGRNRCGTVVIQEQQFFAAREVAKVDARPGGYSALGGHGGILGQITHINLVKLTYLPAYKHTYLSDVNVTKLPVATSAVRRGSDGGLERVAIAVKDAEGRLLPDAIPVVSIAKDGAYATLDLGDDPALELDLQASIDHKLTMGRLAGFVIEGLAPYGFGVSVARNKLLQRAVFSGLPVCRVGRGAPEGFADPHPYHIGGSNLTATKARLLLMACMMKFGSLPSAEDPANPTPEEKAATEAVVTKYQAIFDTH